MRPIGSRAVVITFNGLLKIYNSVRYPKNIPSIDLNNNIFYFSFGAEDPKSTAVFIDETIYHIEAEYYEGIYDEHKKLENGKMNVNIKDAQSFNDLPQKCIDYIRTIEALSGKTISYVSVGPTHVSKIKVPKLNE